MSSRPLTLGARPATLHWAALLVGTLAFVALFRLGGLPAALLLGAIQGQSPPLAATGLRWTSLSSRYSAAAVPRLSGLR